MLRLYFCARVRRKSTGDTGDKLRKWLETSMNKGFPCPRNGWKNPGTIRGHRGQVKRDRESYLLTSFFYKALIFRGFQAGFVPGALPARLRMTISCMGFYGVRYGIKRETILFLRGPLPARCEAGSQGLG